MPNSFATARHLAKAGIEPKHADAIAEAIVTFADDPPASELDLLEAKAELEANIAKIVKREVQAAIAQKK
jgi:hypothetical protein